MMSKERLVAITLAQGGDGWGLKLNPRRNSGGILFTIMTLSDHFLALQAQTPVLTVPDTP